jgi:dihydrolipoamide dehydrogenase
MEHYDLCVIGGGPAGYAGAMRAIDFGKKVLLVEKDKVGGAGLYNGALWSKTMWEYSMRIQQVRLESGPNDASMQAMKKVASEAIFDRKFQMTCHLKLLEEASNEKLFNHEKGIAKLIDDHTVEVTKPNGKIRYYHVDYVLIASGSRPKKLTNLPIDEHLVVTSDGIQNWNELPDSLVIVGAGVIGCEFATIFSNLGKTKVFLIDKAPRILPFEDEDVSEMVSQNFERNGVTIHKGSCLSKMEIRNGRVWYELKYDDGRIEEHEVSRALVSVGRVPNLDELGLEAAGVQLNERGYIYESDTQTNVPNIYAAGDVCGSMALVNVGEREGRHAVVKMFRGHVDPLIYRNISTIMFLNPEVAAVGMGEQDAINKGISVKVAKIDYSCIARAIAMRRTNGFFKIIVSNDAEMKVLGMRAVGEHASSAIQAVALLIYLNKGIEELALMMHPHPSIIEGIQEAMRMLLGKSIYKSSIFKDKLKCYVRDKDVCTPIGNI